MNEREFIKLVRELHLLQLKVLGEEHLSIEIRLSRIKPAYVSFFLNIYDSQRNIRELYFKIMYTGETKNKNSIVNKRILNEIKEKVKESLLLYGGRERSEAERSDAPIK
jgi:hypothetical protein